MTTLPPPVIAGDKPEAIYNRTFWLAYAANVLLVTANALTFRFAEFVRFLGGTEATTGEIVSAGIIGSLLMRLTLGRDLDGHGVRRMWIGSSLLFILGCALMMFARELDWQIYAARVAFSIGLASMFATSISHIQHQVPAHRRTEVIGSLGSSGFVGMILGAQLGDLYFLRIPTGSGLFEVLFGSATLLGICYLAIILFLTRADVHVPPTETHAAHRLLLRYFPGPVLLVAMMMGVGFVVTTVFLTRHATTLGLPGIRTFFTGYAISAFAIRILTRQWSYAIGRHRMILLGLLGHFVGHLLLGRVTTEWDLVLPSIACGFGHALLFPCVISLGSGAFPPEFRGSGTTITMGFMDLGVFLSAPLLGGIIDAYGFHAMFLTSAGFALTIGMLYALLTHGAADSDRDPILVIEPSMGASDVPVERDGLQPPPVAAASLPVGAASK